MTSFALFIAVIMIAAGVLLIGFLLLLRNKQREASAGEGVPKYGDCYDVCKGDSGEEAENCFGLCAYGWP